MFLANMALADACVGLFVPALSVLGLTETLRCFKLCLLVHTLANVFVTVSVMCLVAVTVDRYLHMAYPWWHMLQMNKREITIPVAILSWLSGAFVGSASLSWHNNPEGYVYCNCEHRRVIPLEYSVYVLFLGLYVPQSVLMLVLHGSIFKMFHESNLRIPAPMDGMDRMMCKRRSTFKYVSVDEAKLLKNLFFICSVFPVCFFPRSLLFCYDLWSPEMAPSRPWLAMLTIVLVQLNSLFNPILYSTEEINFRTLMRRAFDKGLSDFSEAFASQSMSWSMSRSANSFHDATLRVINIKRNFLHPKVVKIAGTVHAVVPEKPVTEESCVSSGGGGQKSMLSTPSGSSAMKRLVLGILPQPTEKPVTEESCVSSGGGGHKSMLSTPSGSSVMKRLVLGILPQPTAEGTATDEQLTVLDGRSVRYSPCRPSIVPYRSCVRRDTNVYSYFKSHFYPRLSHSSADLRSVLNRRVLPMMPSFPSTTDIGELKSDYVSMLKHPFNAASEISSPVDDTGRIVLNAGNKSYSETSLFPGIKVELTNQAKVSKPTAEGNVTTSTASDKKLSHSLVRNSTAPPLTEDGIATRATVSGTVRNPKPSRVFAQSSQTTRATVPGTVRNPKSSVYLAQSSQTAGNPTITADTADNPPHTEDHAVFDYERISSAYTQDSLTQCSKRSSPSLPGPE